MEIIVKFPDPEIKGSGTFTPPQTARTTMTDWTKINFEIAEGSISFEGRMIVDKGEKPILELFAERCGFGKDHVLEIGFGLGMLSDLIQQRMPNTHTIIEPHPAIIEKGKSWAKDKRGVRIIEDCWENAVAQLPNESLDVAIYDSFEIQETDRLEHFIRAVHPKLKKGGILTGRIDPDPMHYDLIDAFCSCFSSVLFDVITDFPKVGTLRTLNRLVIPTAIK